jgi:crotonobetainyl-CoA:carnitine CoA-transferase CaiB-like acyl-CoA transferase
MTSRDSSGFALPLTRIYTVSRGGVQTVLDLTGMVVNTGIVAAFLTNKSIGDCSRGSTTVAQDMKQDSESLALDGIRVVECGQGVAAAFAAKLMALMGAEVIKVEPPQGDITRRRGPFFDGAADPNLSGLFLYLNADKRGVTLDLRDRRERQQLDDLLARSDILVHNIAPAERAATGMDSPDICQAHPQLIVAAISPFGGSGPYAHLKAYEINAAHGSAMPSTGPGASPFPDRPPLKLFGHQAEFQSGVYAALTAMAAYFHRITNGGAGQSIDISEQECLAAMSESILIHYTYTGKQSSRLGKYGYGPRAVIACADGWMHMNFLEDAQWDRLMELLGNPAWGHEEIFKDRYARGANADAMEPLLSELTRRWKTNDLFMAAQARRIPVAPIQRASEVYADRQLRSREFFAPMPMPAGANCQVEAPTAPFKSNGMSYRLRRGAPRLGEHNRQVFTSTKSDAASNSSNSTPATGPHLRNGPLSGVRVLDFSWVWAGPFCSLQLAYLGAEVIRIESSKRLCATRCLPPYVDNKPGPNRAGPYNQWSQNKLSIELNLARKEAVEIACELARHCDVAVENFGVGVIDRMGLGYDVLRRYKPDLIMVSMSGYGRTGSYSRFVNYGPQLGAQAGLLSVTGYPGDRPREAAVAYSDPASGLFAAHLVAAALIHKRRTGLGQYIDLSMLEVLQMFFPEMLLEYAITGRDPGFVGNRDSLMAPCNCYQALGGPESWVTIAVGTEAEWRALCDAMEQPALADDPRFADAAARKRNEDELDRIISQWTSRRDRWETTQLLQRHCVAAFPSFNSKDLAEDPHLRERGFLVALEHAEGGVLTEPGIPWHMSGTPCRVRRAAPPLGCDTDDVLTRLLGYSPDRISALRRDEIVI